MRAQVPAPPLLLLPLSDEVPPLPALRLVLQLVQPPARPREPRAEAAAVEDAAVVGEVVAVVCPRRCSRPHGPNRER